MTLVRSYTRRGSELMRLSVETLLRIEKSVRRRAEKSAKELSSFRVFSKLPLKSLCNGDQNGPERTYGSGQTYSFNSGKQFSNVSKVKRMLTTI